ncbi:hypothetical protein K435DRAFT_903017 [Dendrothele bispora CBS 962.96]|uniref:Uncharacterized protein n=1 Tax=Dendrothele bispora (strain CBS 962.96) TaxID=1314807 RepID=A0A4S8KLS5_DENBC|nr:hypothetical protein K435DRAFT_903017 [Dendrothele bispora CBS 962.96]
MNGCKFGRQAGPYQSVNEDLGLPVKVPGEVRERLWSWWNALNDLYYEFEERGHSLTNKEWRILKGALKSIAKISLSNLNDRLLDICKMSTYVPYVADISNWDEQVSRNIDMEAMGFSTPEQRGQLRILLRNAHEVTIATAKNYVDSHIDEFSTWMNEALDTAFKNNSQLQQQIATLEKLVDSQRELLQSYKVQLDRIPADAGSGHKASKIPEPPTFSGSDNKMTLEETARLQSPATTYMKSYYDKVRLGQDLGSWLNFVKELNQIYGKRDDKEGAKDEITALWSNKGLASKDFIKYAEQYRTLARILDYRDGLHIDKLHDVIPQELRNSLVMYCVS